MKLRDALNESKFGQFDVTNYGEIVPKYRKQLQSYLTANKGGKLYGIVGNGTRRTIDVIGDRVIVTLNMDTLKVDGVSLIWK